MRQVIVVRRRSVPLKSSRRDGEPPIWASIWTVRSIMARDCDAVSELPSPRRSMLRSASALRPRRMSHQGDSGARKRRIMRGVCSGGRISIAIRTPDMTKSSLDLSKCQYQKITHGENPLQSKGNTPGPFIVTLVVAVSNGRDDDRTNGPRHLQRGRASTSQGERDNLTGICRTVGN